MSMTEHAKIEYIKILLESFFEGATSNKEEGELFEFFAKGEVPPELMPYKSLFAYFETDLEQEFHKIKPDTIISDPGVIDLLSTPLPGRRIRLRRNIPMKSGIRRRFLLNGAAALLLIFLSVTAYHIIDNNDADFDPYEGSFIVKNGVKITDLNQIRPELEATMEQVLYKEHKAEIEFLLMEYEQQSKYIDFVNSFPEGPAREEVIRTFRQINY